MFNLLLNKSFFPTYKNSLKIQVYIVAADDDEVSG